LTVIEAALAPVVTARAVPVCVVVAAEVQLPRADVEALAHFLLQGGTVVARVGGVARLHGQLADALEVVADGAERAFGRLRQRDAVVGVAAGLRQALDLGGHALGDGEAGGVVLGAVDAHARRQALHRRGQGGLARSEVALRVERVDVGVDDRGHV
jgi:hypothetical protein